MRAVLVGILGVALVGGAVPVESFAARDCPPEVQEAQAALKNAQAALKSKPLARAGQEVQAPRAQAGARTQDVQAPKAQQEIQAPRGQTDVQAPRGRQDVQAPRLAKARALIRQAEQACKKGDMTLSAQKAREALALLQ